MLPVNVKLMESDAGEDSRGVSGVVLDKNADFRRFTERMKGMGRVFAVKTKTDAAPRVIVPPSDDGAAGADGDGEWLDCCLREYLERKRLFDNRYRSRAQMMVRIAGLLVVFLVALWAVWPMWRVLIDVETDAYYKALEVPSTASSTEITRAYRAMMKRWHPDHNPNCGQLCREKTERIKEAYDMLLSRGEHRLTLANQYHEGLMSLRSLLSFRGFQISGDAAMNVFMMLLRLRPALGRRSASLRLACSVLILLFCAAHETLFVSGFSFVTAVQLVYHALSMAKASAQQQSIEEVQRNSYFDVVRDAVVLLGCGGVASAALHWVEKSRLSVEEVFRMLYGSVYVLSFLYRFSPNTYDNVVMRKCSLPMTYMDMTSARFTWWRFAASELLFLVDDLFVFTCRIPSAYRVVVYVTHFVSLCQLFMLPWDAPMINVKAAAKKSAARAAESQSPAAGPATPKAAGPDGGDALSTAPQTAVTESFITKEEEDVVANLDGEAVSWLDIASVKYKALVVALSLRFAQQRGQSADAVHIAASADWQNVVVVAFSRGMGAGPAATQQRFDVLCQVRDPEMCRLVAMERGPAMMTPPRPNAPWSLDLARAEYEKGLGAMAALTNAQVWRKRVSPPASRPWSQLLVAVGVCTAVAAIAAAGTPSPHDVVRSSKGLDGSLRPQLFARYAGTLPADNFVNALSGGLLTVLRVPVCTLDWWDVGATLGFVR